MSSEYRYATFYHNLDIVALHARCVVCLDSIYCDLCPVCVRVCCVTYVTYVLCARQRRRVHPEC